jgi:hypothetical protein
MAKKYLANATLYLQKNETTLFYESLSKGILNYFSEKFNISFSHLNTEIITEKLIEKSINQTLISNTLQIINECEMARFSPLSSINNSMLLEKAKETINEIEKNLTKA